MSCSTASTVMPSALSALIISPVLCVSSADMPAVGSSNSSSFGFRLTAMPISSHCF